MVGPIREVARELLITLDMRTLVFALLVGSLAACTSNDDPPGITFSVLMAGGDPQRPCADPTSQDFVSLEIDAYPDPTAAHDKTNPPITATPECSPDAGWTYSIDLAPDTYQIIMTETPPPDANVQGWYVDVRTLKVDSAIDLGQVTLQYFCGCE
jgi:hypothetical protein